MTLWRSPISIKNSRGNIAKPIRLKEITRAVILEGDFESAASASSAIPAWDEAIGITTVTEGHLVCKPLNICFQFRQTARDYSDKVLVSHQKSGRRGLRCQPVNRSKTGLLKFR